MEMKKKRDSCQTPPAIIWKHNGSDGKQKQARLSQVKDAEDVEEEP